jgi:hypothetical protein
MPRVLPHATLLAKSAALEAADAFGRGMAHEGWKEQLLGGDAAGMKPDQFNAAKLRKGAAEEKEHTVDPDIAMEIAMDHLSKDPKYYDKLEAMVEGPNAAIAKEAGAAMAKLAFPPIGSAVAGLARKVVGKVKGVVGRVGAAAPAAVNKPLKIPLMKAGLLGAAGLGAYGAMKAVPALARDIKSSSEIPLAHQGGWSATPYGYGHTPYDGGMPNVGVGG